jgi:acyl-CoA thioester hydrolase
MPPSFRPPAPDALVHEQERPVLPGEIDALKHVSNVCYLSWVQDVAEAHSESVGWGRDAYRASGVWWLVRRHEIEYLRPAVLGDRVRLRTWVETLEGVRSSRRTQVFRLDPEGGAEQLLVEARTLWVLVSSRSGRPARIPPEMAAAFARPPEA